MSKILSLFFILFGIVLSFSFLIHGGLKTNFFEIAVPELMAFSYKFNFGITFVFTLTIIILHKRFQDQLGYLFLAGSAIKLGIFVFLIKLRGFDMDKKMFLDFFIPYISCLMLEVYIIARLLSGLKSTDNQENV